MPSKSKAQHNLMALAAAGKSSQVPQSVGREFLAADRAQGLYSKVKGRLSHRKRRK